MLQTLVACPACQIENQLPIRRKPAVLVCGKCREELPQPVPFHGYLIEAARFLRNCFLLLALPALSAYAFLHYAPLKATAGLVFCLSLTIASIAFHEFLHAILAYLFGDATVYRRGYLRMNPFKYMLGFHSLVMPAAIFAFSGIFLPGAAVYIRFDRIVNPLARSLVYLAGVAANIIFLGAILLALKSGGVAKGSDFAALLQFAAFCQICIIVFNLLPVPGLDGWGAISPIFADGVQKLMSALSPLIVLTFAALLVGSDSVNRSYAENIGRIVSHFGLEFDAILAGRSYAMVAGPDGCRICAEISGLARPLLGP